MGIALSGAAVETRRIDASASNIANARTTGRLPEAGSAGGRSPYVAVAATQGDVRGLEGQGAGVRGGVKPLSTPLVAEYDPSSPDADAKGMVGVPNVDVGAEFGQQILGARAYSANLSMVRATDDMTRDLLRMQA
ncbi:flagellar basal body rod protein FlgC [Skermanella pratensis]|uniref:flagellar basal body rod protein FlgC n=1 Tax=Skermanella pratensis TaxID=2233999 RepID=UPI0017889D88|nr:flagellar basal body rod C-terminal domain-containing protein [Skermanella pratensis]